MKITIKEIAEDAGVSVSTVSRVISNNPKISEATKLRVREVIERLNYKPNIMARGLVKRKTGILGVIMPKETTTLFSSPFFIEVMQGISLKGKERDYYIMYDFCKNEKEEYEGTKKLTESGLVEGICLMSTRKNDKSIQYLKATNFPFVIIGEPEEKDGVLWVDNNNLKATYDMVKKIIHENSKKIIFVGGDKNLTVTINRVAGFEKACKELKLDYSMYLGKDFSRREGYRLAEKIFSEQKCENFIISDDNLLKGFLDYLEKSDIENVNIGSFNKTNIKESWKNKIFLLDIKPEKLGMEAVNLLANCIQNRLESCNKIVDIEFN